MTIETKRQLLAQVLAGNTEALREYQLKQSQLPANSDHRMWIIDSRAIGGSIIGPDGEWTAEQLEAYPHKNSVWVIRAHSDGARIPEPDEQYDYIDGQYVFHDKQ